MASTLTYSNQIPGRKEFFQLFESTGWNKKYRLNAEDLEVALKNSWFRISAYDGDRLVGFGRVICDGTVHALILDLIVLPDYQGRGIGGNILKMLVDECLLHGIRDIQLFSAAGKGAFYRKRGFVERPAQAPGMELNYELNN